MKQMKLPEVTIALSRLRRGPYQNRELFDPEKLAELATSLDQQGLINPPIVFPQNGHYALLAGERRWRALSALAIAGPDLPLPAAAKLLSETTPDQLVDRFPALKETMLTVRVSEANGKVQRVLGIVDNLQREDLSPIEEGRDYLSLKQRWGYNVHQICKLVGASEPKVAGRLMWVTEFPEEIQMLVHEGKIPRDKRVAEALLTIPNEDWRIKQAHRFAGRRSSIPAIISGCRRTVVLLEGLAKQTRPVVKLSQVPELALVPGPSSTNGAGRGYSFCERDAEMVRSLAEEFCGPCSTNGLTVECLSCPGTLEFIEKLVEMCADA